MSSFYFLYLNLSSYLYPQPFPIPFLPCEKIRCPLLLFKAMFSTCAFDHGGAYWEVVKSTSFGVGHPNFSLNPNSETYYKWVNFC